MSDYETLAANTAVGAVRELARQGGTNILGQPGGQQMLGKWAVGAAAAVAPGAVAAASGAVAVASVAAAPFVAAAALAGAAGYGVYKAVKWFTE